MNKTTIILLLILLYFFPVQVNRLYSYMLGKLLIYTILIMIACHDNISGILLAIIFIIVIHNNNTNSPDYLNNQVPLIKSSTTLIDLEQNLKPVDSKI